MPITALRQNHYIQSVVKNLRKTVPAFREDYATIVHGDVRHSNWIETESGLIYLVDWDSVRLTDRMLDVAHILSHYIPDSNWRDWLGYYGYKYNQKYLINSIGLVNTLSCAKLLNTMKIMI